MKHPLAVCAAVLLWLPRFGAADENALTLDQALARARERAPAIAVARVAVDQARGRLQGASALLRDNPEIEASAGTRRAAGDEQLEGSIGVRQMFELGGRRRARLDGAEAAVARESAGGDEVTRRILRQTAVAFLTALHAGERTRLAEQTAGLAAETLRVARRRVEAGDIGILDGNVAAMALARARAEAQAQAAQYESVLGELRLVLGMAADEPLSVRGDLRERPRHDLPALLAQIAERPDLRSFEAEVREAEANARLGRALQWPTAGVGATYERDDGADIAMGSVILTLPVFERGQGARAEAAASTRRAALALDAGRRAAEVEVRAAFAAYQRRQAAVAELERDALPLLDSNEALTRRSYEAGQLSLFDALTVRREIIEARAEYLSRLFEAAVAGVELQAAAGVLQ